MKCEICEKEYKPKSFGNHLRSHNLTSKQYYNLYLKKENEDICKICGKSTKFHNITLGYSLTCGKKECKLQQNKNTCIKKYGCENPMQNKDIIEKTQKTCKEKYGGCGYQSPKTKETIINKYGAENVYASEYGKTKIKETMNKKYGVDYATQNKEILEKALNTNRKNHNGQLSWNSESQKETMNKRYGKRNYVETNEFKEKSKYTKINKYGSSYQQNFGKQGWKTHKNNERLDQRLDENNL